MISIVVGFPGETKKSISDTLNLFRYARPDFYFLVALNTRVKNVPMLNDQNKVRFKFWTNDDTSFTSAPYWRHYTMGCDEVGDWVLYLNEQIAKERTFGPK